MVKRVKTAAESSRRRPIGLKKTKVEKLSRKRWSLSWRGTKNSTFRAKSEGSLNSVAVSFLLLSFVCVFYIN
jgi:hypothetical protein